MSPLSGTGPSYLLAVGCSFAGPRYRSCLRFKVAGSKPASASAVRRCSQSGSSRVPALVTSGSSADRFTLAILSASFLRAARWSYVARVTAAHDYSELHQLIDRLEPGQAAELREHALRLVGSHGRFRVLKTFDGPSTDLAARAKELARTELGEDDAAR